MGNKKIGLGLMLNLIGAMFAYLIGSGFASGQETMQYFSGWGSVWTSLGVAVIALLLSCLAYIAYSYAGRTRGLKDLAGIYDFYAGNVFGKLFQVFAWLFNACCYMFMISGFGNVFHQQWGISIPIGSAIGVVLSVTIAVMGLNKIIDIIGKVGPIIVLFTLFIGIVAAFKYYPMIAEGNAAINSGDVDVIQAGSNWVTAGLSFGGCNLLLVSAFVGTIGYNLREYKFIYNQLIMIISSGGIMLVSFLMGLNHIGNHSGSCTGLHPLICCWQTAFSVEMLESFYLCCLQSSFWQQFFLPSARCCGLVRLCWLKMIRVKNIS